MLSRRRLITAGAATSAAALLLPAIDKSMAARQAGVTLSGNVADFVALTVPSDPNFASKLNTLFPGLLDDPVFQKIQSHAVLISNVSDEVVNACSTHWRVATPTNGYETTIRHYFHPTAMRHKSAHFGVKGNRTRFTGKIPLLKVGASRLVTPYFNWSPQYYRKNPRPMWKKILTEKESRKFFLYELSMATSVQVSIDAVIVRDKALIGEDKSNLGKAFRATRNAEHDEAVEVLQYIATGASPDQIKTFLQERASIALPARSDWLKHFYSAVRQRQAKVLLRRLNYGKREKFLRTLKYLKKQPNTVLTRIVSN